MRLFHKDIRNLGEKPLHPAWLLLSIVKSEEITMMILLQITIPFTKMVTKTFYKDPIDDKKSRWIDTPCKQQINIMMGIPRWGIQKGYMEKWRNNVTISKYGNRSGFGDYRNSNYG